MEKMYSKKYVSIIKKNYTVNEYSLSDLESYINSTNINTLSEEDALSCEGLLTEKECFDTLSSMGNNKSPGSDGLTVEFYKCLWNDLKQMLIDSLNEGYNCQEQSASQKQASFTLIHKKNDKRCLDYKITDRC